MILGLSFLCYVSEEQVTTTLVDNNISSILYCYESRILLEKELTVGLLWLAPHGDRYIQRLCFFVLLSREADTGPVLTPRSTGPRWRPTRPYLSTRLATLSDWPPESKTPFIIYFSDANTVFLPVQFWFYFRCPLFTLRHSCTSCLRNPHQPTVKGQYEALGEGVDAAFHAFLYCA